MSPWTLDNWAASLKLSTPPCNQQQRDGAVGAQGGGGGGKAIQRGAVCLTIQDFDHLCIGRDAGIDSGMTLSAGEVAAASGEHPGAELYVEVLVQPHPLFERAGSDVVLPHHLDMVDAALGTEITCV